MRICTNCGTTNTDGARACKRCGSEIETVNSVVVKTHYRRRKTATHNQSKPNDFNPVQNFQEALNRDKSQNPPLRSTTPISDLEYKFHSPSSNNGSLPLQSIPPTPANELKIPQPIRPRRKKPTRNSQPLNEEQSPIHLSDDTIENEDLQAIPQNLPFEQVKVNKPTVVRKQNVVQNNRVTQPQKANPKMVFGSQSLQSQQIENEMNSVISVLQGQPTKNRTPKKKLEPDHPVTDTQIPQSLTDILVNLSQLDANIEASALVDVNGKIIAKAISERIDEFLISTITNTLGTISQDVIASLESGDLKFVSIFATKGILFLSPIMKNVFLVLYTSPDAKMGLINLAKIVVKKKIELFYAKRNLKKSPV